MAKAGKTSAAEWAKRVERWKQSGLTAAQYGAQTGLDSKQLFWWRWHLGRQTKATAAPKDRARQAAGMTFLPARIVEPAPPVGGGQVEIVLANGRIVRVTGSVDAAVLAQVVRAAESDGRS